MTSTDSSNIPVTHHVATLLDELITWRTIGNKQSDTRGTTNIQPHGGAWMPADRSFDRILFWRTIENNSFQLFEYSMSRNLLQNAVQIQFGVPTTVLPNVFIVELPDRQEICLMFATHIGVYRWILKYPIGSNNTQSDQSQSILADITDDYLINRNHFYRHELQSYSQVTCAYTNDHLIYALYNEMETVILRFDNQDYLNSPQQLTYPKRQSGGLFNFLWNPNKSLSSNQQTQPFIAGQTTIIYSNMTMTIILYDNGLLRFLSDQLDTILYEYNLSNDLSRSSSKTPTKMFLDYCQYETFSDELITRLFVINDSNDLLHVLIYEFQYDTTNNFKYSLYQNKSYTKSVQSNDHSHLANGSSLTSISCTNDRLLLHLLTNQNRSILLLLQYELKSNHREQFIELPMDFNVKYFNDESTPIDDIQRRLNSPGQFTIDMIKDAFWITFNRNLDELNQSWVSLTQILQQLPIILQNLCNDHCEENSIRNEDRLQILTKFWQNLYSTLIDLRAHALVLLGCRIFDERQLVILIHKSAISLYSTSKSALPSNLKYSRYTNDIETLMNISDEETIAQIDDVVLNEISLNDRQLITQKLNRIQKHLEPIVNNDQIVETLQSLYDKHLTKISSNDKSTNVFTSKIARRLLVLVFIQRCHEKINQIERLNKLIPLVFRSNQTRISAHRLEKIQEKVLPYLQELSQIHQVLLWLSSCGIELSTISVNDRDLFIENLVYQQPYKTRIGNQSLLEQILADNIPSENIAPDSDNWLELINKSADNLFSLLWPSNEFLLKYLPSRHQWTILDQYCGKLDWFKELNASRQFFHALTFYRSGVNIDTATRHLAVVLKELHTDPLLIEMFGKQSIPELFYIEWIREYLIYFGQNQHVASFLHQSLQSSHSNDIRALIIKELFKTSIDLKNFDDAFWCIQNTNDYLSQKQFTFDYASAICSLSNDQSLYRLETLIQYQHDKLGYLDFELLAYLERTCVESQQIQASNVYTLYEIYKIMKLPLKMAQIMYHYGCSISDIKEQLKAFQLTFDALSSMEQTNDSTERLFTYPINYEYNSLTPLHIDHKSARLIGIDECQQKLAIISAIYTLRTNRSSSTIQITDTMHPTQISGILAKFHYHNEAQQLLDAFQINKSSAYFVH
ncbi:unnamed protein product [Rotaria magnacalcarata]|uniref:Nucleoporin Nup120/160 beta-propeller domain-containing protein n=2 Tax=Rotaria magnacalcarata TaxID=392030 RepID=A0A814UY20_9BILA|nr:unnamed protein product [Rotaria magnacalcarata]CAF2111634.1 unnamed protein product [Rotaria magnacalcarata]